MKYEIIKLGKKEMPIYFGFNALRKFCRATGTTLQKLGQLGQDMSLDDVVELIYFGTMEGHRKAKIDFDLTSDDIADMLDGDQNGMNEAMQVFSDHMGMVFQNDKNEKTEKKQKPVKKTK